MKEFISFSGGVESRTMAVLYGGRADAIFADTGFEHDALYKEIDRVERVIADFHGNNFKIHRVKADNVQGTGQDTLLGYINKRLFYPGIHTRFCTRLFKIAPIDKFLMRYEQARLMIGLNFDEGDKRTGNYGLLSNVEYTYPLIENKINRSGCVTILKAAGLMPAFPVYMRRGGCRGCFYKSKKEFAAMALLSPDEFDEIAEIEKRIQDERGKYYHIIPEIPNLVEFGRQARAILFNKEDIFSSTVADAGSCGVFCHR